MNIKEIIANKEQIQKENAKIIKKITEQNNVIAKHDFCEKIVNYVNKNQVKFPLSINCENEDGEDIMVFIGHINENEEIEYDKLMNDLYKLMNKSYKGKINFSTEVKDKNSLNELFNEMTK